MSIPLYIISYLAQYILQTAETEDDSVMIDFSFLSPSSLNQPPPNLTLQSSPPRHTPNPPPLIILDDYSVTCTHQDPSTEDQYIPMASPESPSPRTHFYLNHSASGDSDSEMCYPPSSGGPSEASSAAVSESDLPSAAASEADLPSAVVSRVNLSLQSHLRPSVPKKQTGISDFFRTLSEGEVEAARAKRKRSNSEEEEADRAARRQKEERQREEKVLARREGNRLAQQKRRRKLVAIDIQAGVRGKDGKKIVSLFSDSIPYTNDLIIT